MAGGTPYSKEEADFLARLWVKGYTNKEVWEAHRQSGKFPDRAIASISKSRHQSETVLAALERAEKGYTVPERVQRALSGEHEPGITFEHVTKPPALSVEAMWKRAETQTRAMAEWHKQRHFATIRFKTDQPIALSFVADQHISQGGPVLLDKMREDAELIRDAKGVYAILGGDGVDNHIKHQAAMVNSESRPGNEWKMYDHYLKMFGHKIVGAVSGNHDDWTQDITGHDAVSALMKRNRIWFAPDYFVMTVELESSDGHVQPYVVKIRHQYRFNSTINETHSVKQMLRFDDHDFDIGVLCHKHKWAYEEFEHNGLERIALRPGSYQVTSGYSRRYGYGQSTPTCPTVILWPNARQLHGFRDVHLAADYLQWARNR